jgi:choline dehydrogenase-like flavoprotein
MAWALSNAGFRVMVVESGRPSFRDADDWNAHKILVDSRYKSMRPVEIAQYGNPPAKEYLNEVVGGLSVFYGGACIRLRETDFARWPISYQDMESWYTKAEELMEVHGVAGNDPFEPPRSCPYPHPLPPLTNTAKRIQEAGEQLGLKPFAMPLAINHSQERKPLCVNCFTCDGFPCPQESKNEADTIGLQKARQDRLDVRSNTLVTRLEWQGDRIKSAELLDLKSSRVQAVEADLFVVSGGTLHSPALLLRSGLATCDQSDSIGRYLMRHCNMIVGSVFFRRINPENTNHKQIVITDSYEDLRDELGTAVGIIQDMCMPPPQAVRHNAPKGLGTIAASLSTHIQAMICIAEDDPQEQNRVTVSKDKKDNWGIPLTHIHHEYNENDIRRRTILVKTAKKVLGKAGGVIKQTQKISSFSHGVGTIRFGEDPKKSALDLSCRLHGMKNLYVADGSFMPYSGGVNPSLTIVANSLRVAGSILEEHSA